MASITDFAPIRTRAATPTRTFWRAIVTAIKVMGERNRLAQLEDHQLADIGLDRVSAAKEAARPVWDLPQNR